MGIQNPDPEKYKEGKGNISIDFPRPPDDRPKSIPPHTLSGGERPLASADPYGELRTTDQNELGVAEEARKNAKVPSNPTTASEDPDKRLPEAVMSADPNGQSQVLANMMKSMLTIAMIMSFAGNKSSSKPSPISSPVGKTMSNAFSAALSILTKKYKPENILTAFDNGFGVDGILFVTLEYQDMVHAGLSKLISDIILYGDNNIPTLIVPTFTYGKSVPVPLYTFPPDMYVKQYEPQEEIDFPDYILWVGPDGDRVWTQRTPEQPPYKSADQEILTTSAYEIAAALDPFIKLNSVTPADINDILAHHNTVIPNKSMNLVVGNNSSNSSTLINNLTLILGLLGTIMSLAQTLGLPKSVVDAGKVGIAITAFSRNMATIKRMQSASKGAFGGNGALGAIAGLGALAGVVGSLGGNGLLSQATNGLSGALNDALGPQLTGALSQAAGVAITVAGAAAAMRYSGASLGAVNAASNILKNMRIAT